METLESFVGGSWIQGTDSEALLVNPATAEPIARVELEGIASDAVLRFGRDVGGPTLREMSFAERGATLLSLSKSLHAVREELIEASIVNGGGTRSDAKFDIDGATGTLAYYGRLGETLGDQTVLVDGEGEPLTRSSRLYAYHLCTPKRGVAVHINAFNFPAWGLAEKAATALLAGVPVISKPSIATALTAHRVARVFAAELPRGVFQFLCGSTQSMLDNLDLQDVIAFTGSSATAAQLRDLPAVRDRSVRLNVEADSLNAAVLGRDVDVDGDLYRRFIRDCAKEITQKTGQKCTAIRRIVVPARVVDAVQRDLGAALDEVVVGDPSLPEVEMGPLATAKQLRDVQAGTQRLEASGARVVAGSHVPGRRQGGTDQGFFVGPLLLRADAAAPAVHTDEVFGPVATLLPYENDDGAIQSTVRGGGGLLASIYSDDADFVRSIGLRLAPFHGRVYVGSSKIVDQALPPGAVLASCVHGGPGRAGGGEELGGIRGLSLYQQRTVFQGDRALLARLLPPPQEAPAKP